MTREATKPSTILIRPATPSDVQGMADVFFHSFNQVFWQYFCPENEANRAWIVDMWTRGIHASTDRSFVAVDTSAGDRIVGVSRWQLPLYNEPMNHEAWPEPTMLDQEIAVPFFGGMDINREKIMLDRPHWCKQSFYPIKFYAYLMVFIDLDMIGVHDDYQGQSIGGKLMSWGIAQADKQELEVFLHGTQIAQPMYKEVGASPSVGLDAGILTRISRSMASKWQRPFRCLIILHTGLFTMQAW